MASRRVSLGWLGLLAMFAVVAPVPAQRPSAPATNPVETIAGPICRVPLDELPPTERERVRVVLERPTLTTRGPSEIFTCRPEHYHWLLDHPDQAVRLWRLLGIKCSEIADKGGYFSWDDGKGSHMRWHEVYRGSDRRVLYAEGKVDPGYFLPTASVKAVVVVHHTEGTDAAGRPAMRQRIEMALHTDSHAVATAARLIGASAPHLAQQYVGQMQMFYGALAWYLNQHPRHAEVLFEQLRRPAATDRVMPLPAE
jgi:hypothetical protein